MKGRTALLRFDAFIATPLMEKDAQSLSKAGLTMAITRLVRLNNHSLSIWSQRNEGQDSPLEI